MRGSRYRSIIIVPVSNLASGVVGSLTPVRTAGSEPYDDLAVLFAQDLGRRCGIAISKAKYHAQALDVSNRFQRLALPDKLPRSNVVELDAHYEAAQKEMFIGGDWYDAVLLPDGKIALSVGDVSGHGIDAAAMMGFVRVSLRTALAVEQYLAKALDVVDYMFRYSARGDLFATASIALFDPHEMTLKCESAGHPGPLIWNQETCTVTDPFQERGLPLGFRDLNPNQNSATIPVTRGTLAVFFTDGLVEWTHDYLAGERSL